MKRLLKATAVLCVVISLIGCQYGNNNISISSAGTDSQVYASNNQVSIESADTTDPDLYLEPFNMTINLNLFYGSAPCEYNLTMTQGNELTFDLVTSVAPDQSMDTTDIPLRIYVIADGVPLNFKLSGSDNDSEYAIMHERLVNGFEDNMFSLTAKLDSDNIRIVSVICAYYPEHIPLKGYGAYRGVIEYDLINTEHINEVPQVNDTSFYVSLNIEDAEFDIGNQDLNQKNNKDIIENHLYDDITLSGNNRDLYIKFNSGSKQTENNIPFYVILFRDGKMLKAFNDEYSCMVDCNAGKRTFQYKIPEELIPNEGLHTFQALFLPAFFSLLDDEGCCTNYATNKVRVCIS